MPSSESGSRSLDRVHSPRLRHWRGSAPIWQSRFRKHFRRAAFSKSRARKQSSQAVQSASPAHKLPHGRQSISCKLRAPRKSSSECTLPGRRLSAVPGVARSTIDEDMPAPAVVSAQSGRCQRVRKQQSAARPAHLQPSAATHLPSAILAPCAQRSALCALAPGSLHPKRSARDVTSCSSTWQASPEHSFSPLGGAATSAWARCGQFHDIHAESGMRPLSASVATHHKKPHGSSSAFGPLSGATHCQRFHTCPSIRRCTRVACSAHSHQRGRAVRSRPALWRAERVPSLGRCTQAIVHSF